LGTAYIGYAAIPYPIALLSFSVLRGMGYGLFYVGTVRVITDRTPPEWSATVQGTMNATAFGLAQLISGPVAGRIYDSAGPVAVYIACVAVVGVAIVLLGGVSAVRFRSRSFQAQ
jgi:MFS transporter, PPP family, 3-phenylpropionic acid transporter